MTDNTSTMTTTADDRHKGEEMTELVTMTIAGQLLGIPVLSVHDVLGPQQMTQIPLAP